MNSAYVTLALEIVLDLVTLVLGVILIVRARDNRLQMVWGIMATLCALWMLWDNTVWLMRPGCGSPEERTSLLMIPRMLKYFLFGHAFSLFPLASMRPGWLTALRILIFSLPLILVGQTGLCYLAFNGYITPLHSFSEIPLYASRPDVQLRLVIFAASVILPITYFFIPFMGRWITFRRRLAPGMYLYIASYLLITLIYILFTLKSGWLIFNTFGFAIIFLPLSFSFLCLRDENPLSLPASVRPAKHAIHMPDPEPEPIPERDPDPDPTVSPQVYRLYLKMTQWMEKQAPFISPDYSIDQLIGELNTNHSLLVKTIRYGGFTGFREYVNFLRLEYFKTLAAASPGASIKELMFRCGFTSRSSFYRQFAEQEQMSPKEYLDQIYRNS